MLNETDIVAGYRWILGREAASGDIAFWQAHFAATPDDRARAFQSELLRSEEFRNRQRRAYQWHQFAPVELDRPRLVFVHIEKCGGTTLRAMLETQFDAARICPEQGDGLGNWTINELARYDFFAGHFDLAPCACIPGQIRTITMLREPKSRLQSLYQFWKSHRPHPDRDRHDLMALVRALPEEDFFSHPDVTRHHSIANAMATQLTRTTHKQAHADDSPLRTDPTKILEAAWQKLQAMTGFGLLERFEESRLLLNRQLGMTMPAMAPRQVLDELVKDSADLMPVPRAPSTARLDRALEELTGIDKALYARACELFSKRSKEALLF